MAQPKKIETEAADDARNDEAPTPDEVRLNPISDHPTDGTTNPPDAPEVVEALHEAEVEYDDDGNEIPPPITPTSTKAQRAARTAYEDGLNAEIAGKQAEVAEAMAAGAEVVINHVEDDADTETVDTGASRGEERAVIDDPAPGASDLGTEDEGLLRPKS